MKRNDLLQKIKREAKKRERLRKDPRYSRTLAFLVEKGFLKTNEALPHIGNRRIHLSDAIWAGENIEPRILEVLPAALIRLPNRFIFDVEPEGDPELGKVLRCLAEEKAEGSAFRGIAYQRLKIWCNLPLRDHRTKPPADKKIMRTFRLQKKVIERLKQLAKQEQKNITDILEQLVLQT